MQANFDNAAATYDQEFTDTVIGRNQRNRVWALLEKSLGAKPLNILELNCGTGEDAIWLAKQGHQVWATDVSEEMLKAINKKIFLNNCSENVRTSIFNLSNPNLAQFKNQQFDLVFSNFGGLNCLNPSEFGNFLDKINDYFNITAKLVLVIMPPNSLYENLAQLAKKSNKRLRNGKNQSKQVNVYGKMVETWYYSPNDILQDNFKLLQLKPTGFLPSYANKHANNNSLFYKAWVVFENLCFKLGLLSSKADHFYIELEVVK